MRGRILKGALLAVALVLAIGFVAVNHGSADPEREEVVPLALSIAGPDRVVAGAELVITVSGVEPKVQVQLSLDGGYGPRRYVVVATSEIVEFKVPPSDRPESGQILVTASQPGRVGVATFEMVPGSPVDPVAVYLGPRTVVADAEHFTMVVAVPLDALGNPVENGSPVRYRVTRPNGVVEEVMTETDNLLSDINVFSRTVTGRTRIAVEAGDAAGPERDFLEVAGVPNRVGIEVVGAVPVAYGSSLLTIRTERLDDKFGNKLSDGVVVYLDLDGATGTRRLFGVTIDSTAEFVVEAPSEPGLVRAVPIAAGIVGNSLEIDFQPAVDEIPIATTNVAGGVEVQVGPVRSVRHAYVPDGTIATVSVGGENYPVVLDAGIGSVVVPAEAGDYIIVEVLGIEAVAR